MTEKRANPAGMSAVLHTESEGLFLQAPHQTRMGENKPLWFFLDDEREPPNDPTRHWAIFRDGEAMLDLIQRLGYLPDGISFDNDLGTDFEGRHVANAITWLVADGLVTVPATFEYVVHSQNPEGAREIVKAMQDVFRFMSRKFGTC